MQDESILSKGGPYYQADGVDGSKSDGPKEYGEWRETADQDDESPF